MNTPIHVRRCHVCGAVNETEERDVQKCDGCGKSLLPFFFFDTRGAPVASADGTNQIELDLKKVKPQRRGSYEEYGPVRGLSAYW